MPEYIEREALMAEIHRIGGHNLCEWHTIGVKALVDRQPAADVVEVVRCKGCKHLEDIEWCAVHGHKVKDTYFCSYGEKMDGKGEGDGV